MVSKISNKSDIFLTKDNRSNLLHLNGQPKKKSKQVIKDGKSND